MRIAIFGTVVVLAGMAGQQFLQVADDTAGSSTPKVGASPTGATQAGATQATPPAAGKAPNSPAGAAAAAADKRERSRANLRKIALALHNYHDVFGRFPPSVIVDPQSGTPRSWRVELLPFLERPDLYSAYDKSQPWDSETNRRVLAKMPDVYRHESQAADATMTSVVGITGLQGFFPPVDAAAIDPKSPPIGRKIAEIPDGTSNTIALVETRSDIPWTAPKDLELTNPEKTPILVRFDDKPTLAVLADGSDVQIVAPEKAQTWFTIRGNQLSEPTAVLRSVPPPRP